MTDREIDILIKTYDQSKPGVEKAERNIKRFAKRVEASFGQMWKRLRKMSIVGIGAAVGLGYFLDKNIKSALAYGVAMDKAAKQTGLTASQIAKLRYAVEQEHGDFEALTRVLLSMTRYMDYAARGMDTYKRYFDELGISVTKADGSMKSSIEVLFEMQAAMHKGTLTSEKLAAVLSTLGGRAALKLIDFLRLSRQEINRLMKEAEDLGIAGKGFDEFVKRAKELDDQVTKLKRRWKGLWVTVGEVVIPNLEPIVQAFDDALAKIAKRMKGHEKEVFEGIKEITLRSLKLMDKFTAGAGELLTLIDEKTMGLGIIAAAFWGTRGIAGIIALKKAEELWLDMMGKLKDSLNRHPKAKAFFGGLRGMTEYADWLRQQESDASKAVKETISGIRGVLQSLQEELQKTNFSDYLEKGAQGAKKTSSAIDKIGKSADKAKEKIQTLNYELLKMMFAEKPKGPFIKFSGRWWSQQEIQKSIGILRTQMTQWLRQYGQYSAKYREAYQLYSKFMAGYQHPQGWTPWQAPKEFKPLVLDETLKEAMSKIDKRNQSEKETFATLKNLLSGSIKGDEKSIQLLEDLKNYIQQLQQSVQKNAQKVSSIETSLSRIQLGGIAS